MINAYEVSGTSPTVGARTSYKHEWYIEHREELLKKMHDYSALHREEIRKQQVEYRAANHAEIYRHQAEYRAAHRAEYSWYDMHQRAQNKNGHNPSYANVHVCKRWSGPKGKENFVKDMGQPSVGTTLSRFGDTGDYKPSNCAWHTKKQQCEEARMKRQRNAMMAQEAA